MVKLALAVAALLVAGCFEDRYTCITDAQCDLGAGGRCEVDGFCTSRDPACPTLRAYEEHAGELANACYDDRVAPLNACAGGQPPAAPQGCFADVCERLPACCELAWTDACVQIAQQVCTDLVCDTRIAFAAVRGSTTELWDARWDGTQWTFTREEQLVEPFAWVGPAPGTIEPRLVRATATTLEIGDRVIDIPMERSYGSVTSIGFDRDNRDTIVAGYSESGAIAFEVRKLDDDSVRTYPLTGNVNTASLSWGDINRDSFPDGVSRTTTQQTAYSFLENIEVENFERKVSNTVTANTQGGSTPGAPGVRNLEWLDLDGDRRLDLAVIGASVRIHTNADGLRDAAERDLDCIPPSTMKPCSDDPEPNLEASAFAGGALPDLDQPSLVIGAWPARKLFRATPGQGNAIDVTPLSFPGDNCSCTANCTNCPGANCSCTYDCGTCNTLLAIIARDLDGDHELDLVVIDSKLRLYTALAAASFAWSIPQNIPTTFANTFFNVIASVSGAPR